MRTVRRRAAAVAVAIVAVAVVAVTAAPAPASSRTGDSFGRAGSGSVTGSGSGASATAATAPAVVIDGKGWGHGVGMSQDGAYAMGKAGASTDDILAAFYPGTGAARRGGAVRVTLLDGAQPTVTLGFPGGGELRDSGAPQAPGFPVTVAPGGLVRLSRDAGGYRATPVSGATAAPLAPATTAPRPPPASPTSTAPGRTTTTLLLGLIPAPPPPPPTPVPTTAAKAPAPTAPATRPDPAAPRPLRAVPKGGGTVAVDGLGRNYRGTVLATGEGGGIQLVNEVDVEQYLRGMGEVRDPGWPPAALRAQAIAARTYVLRAVAGGGAVCSDQQCQVYLGQSAEYAAMDKAVADTGGRVLVYQGALAEAVYSASGGGVSATPAEGFGRAEDDHPYLRAAPYPTLDPQPWSVGFGLAPLAARFGYRGTATSVRVSRAGPSGRCLEVTFDGDAGPLAVEGLRFQSALRLRSTLFTLRPAESAAITEAPVPGDEAPAAVGTGAGTGPVPPMASAMVSARGTSLGRAPWTALAVLLLAAWATLATRVRPRLRR